MKTDCLLLANFLGRRKYSIWNFHSHSEYCGERLVTMAMESSMVIFYFGWPWPVSIYITRGPGSPSPANRGLATFLSFFSRSFHTISSDVRAALGLSSGGMLLACLDYKERARPSPQRETGWTPRQGQAKLVGPGAVEPVRAMTFSSFVPSRCIEQNARTTWWAFTRP